MTFHNADKNSEAAAVFSSNPTETIPATNIALIVHQTHGTPNPLDELIRFSCLQSWIVEILKINQGSYSFSRFKQITVLGIMIILFIPS